LVQYGKKTVRSTSRTLVRWPSYVNVLMKLARARFLDLPGVKALVRPRHREQAELVPGR